MSYYRFQDEDIIDTGVAANPGYTVERNGDAVTGSIFLEKKFLSDPLLTRRFEGFSAREGGLQQKLGPFTASVDIVDAEKNASGEELYQSILQLYDYYSFLDSSYTPNVTGSETTIFRVITIPEIYYDRSILSGTFTGSDFDSNGDERKIYDNGRGGIYSGSLTGTLVGNIFYNEGLVVLKAGGLNEEPNNEFGESSPSNFKWRVNFKGVHNIPVKIFRCRAPAGQLNASTNKSFYKIPTGSSDDFRGEKVRILSESVTYVTSVGLYNDRYELVGMAKLAQPIRKDENQDILFRIRLDL